MRLRQAHILDRRTRSSHTWAGFDRSEMGEIKRNCGLILGKRPQRRVLCASPHCEHFVVDLCRASCYRAVSVGGRIGKGSGTCLIRKPLRAASVKTIIRIDYENAFLSLLPEFAARLGACWRCDSVHRRGFVARRDRRIERANVHE